MKTWIFIVLSLASSATAQAYTTCASWDELIAGNSFEYVPVVRVSDPNSGTDYEFRRILSE